MDLGGVWTQSTIHFARIAKEKLDEEVGGSYSDHVWEGPTRLRREAG